MTKEICFDMDGTIANLYACEGWLDDLIGELTRPYREARPMVNMRKLAYELNRLQRNGYCIKIISWTSKSGTAEYNQRVETAKKKWLARHLGSVNFDEIFVIPYGTPKSNYGNGILFDDEERNRQEWNGIAYDVDNILEILRCL